MKSNPTFSLALMLSLAILAHGAEISLDEMVVRAASEKPPISTQPSLAELTALAKKIPGGSEVISPERLLQSRTVNLADTFYLSPGVVAQSRFGADEARISIRGSGIQRTFQGRGISVLQDGVPINHGDGSFDMQSLDPMMASSIDVLRGTNAIRYGATTLGGAINYTSYTGKNFPHHADVRFDAGSYGYSRAQVRTGFAEGNFDGFFSLQALHQDGFRDHARQDNLRLFSNLGYQISENLETRFYFTQVLTHSEFAGNITLKQLQNAPRTAAPIALNLDQKRNYTLTRVANRTVWKSENHQLEYFMSFTTKDMDHPIYHVIDKYTNDLVVGSRLTSQLSVAKIPVEQQIGFLWSEEDTTDARYEIVQKRRDAMIGRARLLGRNFELYALEDVQLLPSLHWIFGSAWANISRKTTTLREVYPGFEESDSRFSPQTGFLYQATKHQQIFANIAGNYEPPTFSEAMTQLVQNRSQTGISYEIGTRGSQFGAQWNLSLYQSNLKNEFLAIDHDNNPATPAITRNADRTTHRGIELGTEIDFLHLADDESSGGQHIFWRQAYTYGDFRFDNDAKYGNNRLAGLPPQLIRGEFLWQNSHGYYAGPTYEWSPSKTFIDHRNTTAAPSYAIAGLKLGQRKQSGFSWYLELRNLTNRRFAATTGVIEDAQSRDQAQFLPGEGRTVYAGVNYAW